MAVISFSSQLGNPNGTFPKSLIVSLSGIGVDIQTLDTNAKYVVYNPLPALDLTGSTVVLSAYPNTTIRVDEAYEGETFGIVYTNNNSSLFAVITGVSNQILISNNGGSTSYPEWRRLYNLTND